MSTHRKSSCISAALAFAVAWGLPAQAKPVAPPEFCRTSPDGALCTYDPAYALTRIGLDFCGQSPTRSEVESVRASDDWQMLLEEKLAGCLESAFWQGKDGVLWNLANTKILPESSLKSGDDAGDLTIADYEDDYNLFVYINTGDRDARDLLTAKYHVLRDADGALVRVDRTPAEDYLERDADDGDIAQLVPQERRAGMLTTRWFLAKNTMVTPIPRTTAAQAYRAYLGYDIAKMEGLRPALGEPVDYDLKGVTAEQCAVCHSTLDPLSYPFSRYDGLGGGDEEQPAMEINEDGTVNIAYGNYVAGRMERFVRLEGPQIAETPENGLLLGQPVANLVEWAEVAANSEPFARKLVLDYWRLLVGEDPRPGDEPEFARLVQRLSSEHEYRVERMLRDLIATEAYGAP